MVFKGFNVFTGVLLVILVVVDFSVIRQIIQVKNGTYQDYSRWKRKHNAMKNGTMDEFERVLKEKEEDAKFIYKGIMSTIIFSLVFISVIVANIFEF